MELVTPEFGLVFWQIIVFAVVFFALGKFAWKPITQSLKERNESIANALAEADRAKEEMANLKSQNEELLREARAEREKMLRDADNMGKDIVNEAKQAAGKEAARIVEDARKQIENEKANAVTELKNQVAQYSIEIAEKILKEKLSDDKSQQALVKKYLDDVKLN